MESVRLDRWLSAARMFKSRTQAQEACDAGKVELGGAVAACDKPVKVGDRLRVRRAERTQELEVVALDGKRQGPAAARLLYVDHTPAPPAKDSPEARAPARDRGAGRPTKHDRRAMERHFGGDFGGDFAAPRAAFEDDERS
jgi:ribosome-associated heat shock protein Hsp15